MSLRDRRPEEEFGGALLVLSGTEAGRQLARTIIRFTSSESTYIMICNYVREQIRSQFSFDENRLIPYGATLHRYLYYLSKPFGRGDTDDILRDMCPSIEQSLIDRHNQILEYIEKVARAA